MALWTGELLATTGRQLWAYAKEAMLWSLAVAVAAARLFDLGLHRDPPPPPPPPPAAHGPPAEVPDLYWERLAEAPGQQQRGAESPGAAPDPGPAPVDRDDPEALEAALLAMDSCGRRRPRKRAAAVAADTAPALAVQ